MKHIKIANKNELLESLRLMVHFFVHDEKMRNKYSSKMRFSGQKVEHIFAHHFKHITDPSNTVDVTIVKEKFVFMLEDSKGQIKNVVIPLKTFRKIEKSMNQTMNNKLK